MIFVANITNPGPIYIHKGKNVFDVSGLFFPNILPTPFVQTPLALLSYGTPKSELRTSRWEVSPILGPHRGSQNRSKTLRHLHLILLTFLF